MNLKIKNTNKNIKINFKKKLLCILNNVSKIYNILLKKFSEIVNTQRIFLFLFQILFYTFYIYYIIMFFILYFLLQ